MSDKFTRASTKPAHIGWYERKYPLINGLHQHPCPFDFWNGTAWLGGFPDREGDVLPSGHKVQAAVIARDQHLPWRNLSEHKHQFIKTKEGGSHAKSCQA